MSWVALAAATVQGGIMIAKGVKQKRAAKSIKAVAPEVDNEALDMQKNIASRSKMPGQDAMTEQIDAGAANLMTQGGNLSQPGALSSLIGQQMANQQTYKQKLGQDAAKYKADAEAKTVSGVKAKTDKQFGLDQSNYQNALASIQALNQSGDKNIEGAVDTFASGAIAAGGAKSGTNAGTKKKGGTKKNDGSEGIDTPEKDSVFDPYYIDKPDQGTIT
tara:strand:+ start:16537 stop:17190 length:654 start_codon:yes stop_codon:yes gene_type:complete